MNTALQLPPKTVVSTSKLMEQGYMTLEQSKTIIAKKIHDHYHKK